MKYRIIPIILMIFSLVMLAGCGGSKEKAGTTQQPTQQQKITLRFPGTLPVNHHITKSQEYFKKQVEDKVGGKVDIQIYPSQQLYADKDLVDVLPKGGVEMAQVNLSMWTGLVPSTGVFSMLSIYKDNDQFFKAQEGDVGKEVAKDLEEKSNVKLLSWLHYGAGGFISSKPIQKIDDFKSMKMRAQGDYDAAFLKGLGAAPTAMSSADVYLALQRKTIDGGISGPTSFVERKWSEVAKYTPDIFLSGSGFAILMNKDIWGKLPQDVQQALLEAGKATSAWCRAEGIKADKEAWAKLENSPGFTIIKIPPEEVNKMRKIGRETGIELLGSKIGPERAKKLIDYIDAQAK